MLEDNLIHNLKRRRHGDKRNFVVQQGRNDSCVWAISPYESQGIPIRLDALHLAFPHGLCSYRHHRLVYKSEAVAHCHSGLHQSNSII